MVSYSGCEYSAANAISPTRVQVYQNYARFSIARALFLKNL